MSLHEYADADGEPRGCVVRVDFDGDRPKQIRQGRCDEGSWTLRAMDDPRPPYRWHAVREAGLDDPILVVEGERCADRATTLGVIATTSSGGAKAAQKTDWSWAKDRMVVIWPDNDTAGRRYRDHVVRLAHAAGAHNVAEICLNDPQLPPGGDIVDWADAQERKGATRESISGCLRELLEVAPSIHEDEYRNDEASPSHSEHALSPLDVIDRWQSEGPLVHVASGLEPLDKMTGGGLPFGSRTVVLGAPDAGKTAFLDQLADNYLEQGLAVGILAVDEEPGDQLQRFLQRRGWTREQCERRDTEELEEIRKSVGELRLRFYGAPWTIEAAADDLAQFAAQVSRGRGAFLADSLQTIESALEHSFGGEVSTHRSITQRMEGLRAVADQHRFVVVATSETGRQSYRSPESAARTSELAMGKESGSIEYRARVLLSLSRVPGEHVGVELRVVKNKLGPVHRVGTPKDREHGIYLNFDRERQTFSVTEYRTPKRDTERQAARDDKADRDKVQDAARFATVVAQTPGLCTKEAEERVKAATPGRMGNTRVSNARGTLGDALVKLPGPRTAMRLYLNGKALSPQVLAAVPKEFRGAVASATPPDSPAPRRPETPRLDPGRVSPHSPRDAPHAPL